VGTALAGKVIKYGRRRVLLVQAVIGIVGVGITMVPNFYAVIGGRVLYGLSVGMLAIATPRLMEETIPPYLVGGISAMYALSFAFAVLIADCLASILPPDTDTAALKSTNLTMIIFGLPLLFYAIQLLLQFTYFTNESPKYLILNG